MAHKFAEIELPNKRKVFCLRKTGMHYVGAEMAEYFRHGIDVKPGDTVFDVGANIGLFSVTASDRAGGDLDVYAFEPIPRVQQVLALNAERHGGGRIRAFCCGLSDAPKRVTFSYYPRMSIWSSAHRNQSNWAAERQRNKNVMTRSMQEGRAGLWLKWMPAFMQSLIAEIVMRHISKVKQIDCELKTLSQVVREQGVQKIDLLKVDVEKSEIDVLRGIEAEHWPLIRQVVMEVEDSGQNLQIIRGLLESHGFEVVYDQDEVQRLGDFGMLYARRSD